jgi:hypothetical protein
VSRPGAVIPPAPSRERRAPTSSPAGERRWRWVGAAREAGAQHPRSLAFGLYFVLGLLTAGWYAISNPTAVCACIGNYSLSDPATYMWSLGWWPHALVEGLNPFMSHYVFAPTGANLARAATIPTASLALSPVTALFGPLASYNVMSVASPILAAFTAYLLCRHIVSRELPALAGGYLFGFGPYEFAQLVNHANLSLIFLIPVMVLLALRRAEREISARAYVLWLALVFALQVGLSTEILSTAVLLGLVLFAAARLLAPQPYRGRIGGLLAETVGAGFLAAVVTSPFLYYALIKGGMPHELPFISDAWGLDLLNPVIPTSVTWLSGHGLQSVAETFDGGNIAEADGYLALPIIVAFVWWAARTKRRFLARMLIIAAVVSFLAALGSHLHVEHQELIALPYNWVRNLPIFRLITPARIVIYTSLALAIGVAAWLAEGRARSPGGVARWLLVGLGAVMIFPNISSGLWGGAPTNPEFFRSAVYRRYLRPGETALVLPYGADANSMFWQAETGFYFRMPEGYLGHFAPPQFEGQRIVSELNANEGVDAARLEEFLRAYHVRDIVIQGGEYAEAPYASVLAKLGLQGTWIDGVHVYPLPEGL